MILVLDTNVVVSAQVFGGTPRILVAEALKRGHLLATCAEILAEVEEVFQRDHIIQAAEKAGIPPPSIRAYARITSFFPPIPIPPTVRDPDDDIILGCALAAKADMVVSGDLDLLDLGSYENIRIMTVSAALQQIISYS